MIGKKCYSNLTNVAEWLEIVDRRGEWLQQSLCEALSHHFVLPYSLHWHSLNVENLSGTSYFIGFMRMSQLLIVSRLIPSNNFWNYSVEPTLSTQKNTNIYKYFLIKFMCDLEKRNYRFKNIIPSKRISDHQTSRNTSNNSTKWWRLRNSFQWMNNRIYEKYKQSQVKHAQWSLLIWPYLHNADR